VLKVLILKCGVILLQEALQIDGEVLFGLLKHSLPQTYKHLVRSLYFFSVFNQCNFFVRTVFFTLVSTDFLKYFAAVFLHYLVKRKRLLSVTVVKN